MLALRTKAGLNLGQFRRLYGMKVYKGDHSSGKYHNSRRNALDCTAIMNASKQNIVDGLMYIKQPLLVSISQLYTPCTTRIFNPSLH